jgi:predicted DNA-binding ribbon-helix-helix protein
MSKHDKHRTIRSFQVEAALWRRLKVAAAKRDLSLSYLLRRFLTEGLDRLESKAGLKL